MRNTPKRLLPLLLLVVMLVLAACDRPDSTYKPPVDKDDGDGGVISGTRFDFSGAVGVQIGDASGAALSSSDADSNLYKVLENGQLENALVSGNVNVAEMFIRNGKIYLILHPDWAVDPGDRCVLAEVNQFGEVMCVDAEISSVDLYSIQFDARDGIYYRGQTHEGRTVIRQSVEGHARDFYKADDAISINKFFVTRDGLVILEGTTHGGLDSRDWIRTVDASNRITEYPAGMLIDFLPDGTLLFSEGYGSVIQRFMIHDGFHVDPRPYCNGGSSTRVSDDYELCNELLNAHLRNLLYRDQHSVVALTPNGLTRVYPMMESIELPIHEINNGAIALGQAVIAGYGSNNAPVAVHVNLDSGRVTDMLGSRRIEVLRLMLRLEESRVLIYGLDQDRNQAVLAEYDLRTGDLNVADVRQQLADSFQELNWTASHVPPEPSVPEVPVPTFELEVLTGWGAGTVAFDASASTPTTWVDEATWDFGDGTVITVPARNTAHDWLWVQHSYARPGTYTVTLTLTDQVGGTHVAFRTASVPLTSRTTKVAAGEGVSFALREDGTVWAWGSQYGAFPVRIDVPGRAVDIVAAWSSVAVLLDDQSVWVRDVGYRETVPVSDIEDVVEIDFVGNYLLALDEEGGLWMRNVHFYGGSQDDTELVLVLDDVTRFSGGGDFFLALRRDGTVWAWGDNFSGQLGDATTEDRSDTPIRVNLNNVEHVEAGSSSAFAILVDGSLWAWGSNHQGELGIDSATSQTSTPTRVSGLEHVTGVSASGSFTVATTSDGSVWVWGADYDRLLLPYSWWEDPVVNGRPVPVRHPGLTGIIQVAGGYRHALALSGDGSVWAWGGNSYGELSYPPVADYRGQATPIRVTGHVWAERDPYFWN